MQGLTGGCEGSEKKRGLAGLEQVLLWKKGQFCTMLFRKAAVQRLGKGRDPHWPMLTTEGIPAQKGQMGAGPRA